jgi:hypothetical protein
MVSHVRSCLLFLGLGAALFGCSSSSSNNDSGNLNDSGTLADSGSPGDSGTTDAGGITVAVTPQSPAIAVQGTQQFSATVTGTSNTAVNWSVDGGAAVGTISSGGLYTAPAIPGAYQVIATSQVSNTATGSTVVTVSGLPAGPAVSGTVTYAGARQGRIYIGLFNSGCNGGGCSPNAGTSLGAPGAFTIHVGSFEGNYQLIAFMDTVGNQQVHPSSDPFGMSSAFSLTGINVTGVGITLTDPTAAAVPDGGGLGGYFSNDAAIMGWTTPNTAVDHAKIYYAQASGSCPTTKGGYSQSITVPAQGGNQGGGGPGAFIRGLTQGANYCFADSFIADGTEGGLGPATGPVTVQAPTGNHSVSGQIFFPGLTATGPLYVAAVVGANSGGGPTNIIFTDVAAPASPQSFTITGLPNGTYGLYAFIDMGNTGAFGPGFVGNTNTNVPPLFMIDGGDLSGSHLELPTGDAEVFARTDHFQQNQPLIDDYDVSLEIDSNVKDPVQVSLIEGTHLLSQLDLGLNFYNGGGSSARFVGYVQLGSTVPDAGGDSYLLETTFSDTSVEGFNAAITGVLPVATLVSPINGGTTASTTPSFSWTLPSGVEASAQQEISVSPNMGGQTLWQESGIPLATTGINYNEDGSGQALQTATAYSWWISLYDYNQNYSQSAPGQFTTP